jgi:hypothetical protein
MEDPAEGKEVPFSYAFKPIMMEVKEDSRRE